MSEYRYPSRINAQIKPQRGFLIIGAAIAVMTAAALLALASDRMVQEQRLLKGKQIGETLSILGDGLEVYLNTNYSALFENDINRFPTELRQHIPDPRNVTPEQLIKYLKLRGVSKDVPGMPSANYAIKFDFPSTGANGQSCTTRLIRFSDPQCRITGLVYLDQPITRSGGVDGVATARAARTIGRFGGYSPLSDPAFLEFVNGPAGAAPLMSRMPNPVATHSAGILVRAVNPLLYQTEYLRVDGVNTMEATLQMQDVRGNQHSIDGAMDVKATRYVWATKTGTGSDGAWLTGDGDVIAATGDVTARRGSVSAWVGNITARRGDFIAENKNFVAEKGNFVAKKGNMIADEGFLQAKARHMQGNTFIFNTPSATRFSRSQYADAKRDGLFAQPNASCGNAFAIAAGPSRTNSSDSEQLYICTHDVYESSKAVIEVSGAYMDFDRGTTAQNAQNPGYYRSRNRVWRPIDQKHSVVQRYQLRDEAWTKVALGRWRMCVDSTAPFDTYKSTAQGYPSPIVGRFNHDVQTNEWQVDYWRNTNDQRTNGSWGYVTCSGKV